MGAAPSPPAEENSMRMTLRLAPLAAPLLLAACGTHETNEPPLNTADSPFYDPADNQAGVVTPPDNSVPAATIPEQTMPPVLPDPVDTNELATDDILSNTADNGSGGGR
jgi:hypothetical protein